MQIHTFELRHNRGDDMELIILNPLSRDGIVIPLSNEERKDLIRTLKFGED
jgi:hypothetical protein